MLSSLKWHVLWPVGTVLVLVLALAVFQLDAHRRTVEGLSTVTGVRESLDRAMNELANRHDVTVRRARNALRRPGQRVALLAWTSEHYAREMDRLLAEAQAVVAEAGRARRDRAAEANLRIQRDAERIADQLHDVQRQSRRVAAALDLMLEGASAEDEIALTSATAELDRADAAMAGALGRASDLVRKASSWQFRDLAAAPTRLAWPLLLLIGLSLPLAFWLATRPLRRVAELAAGVNRRGSAQSHEEQELRRLLADLRADAAQLGTQAEERAVASERATQNARRLEHELALLRLYNENLVNSLRSAIVVTDASGAVTAFNRTARRLLGLTDDHLGQALETLALYRAVASRSTNAAEQIERALAGTPLRLEGVDYRRDLPAGEAEAPGTAEITAPAAAILLDLTVVPYLDEVGAARGLLWVSDDITDAVRTKNQLLAAEQLAAVGRLSAQVAHEIRNPLSAIGLNAELLAEVVPEMLAPARAATGGEAPSDAQSAEVETLIRAIASEVERLSQVTEGYLRLARLPRPDCRDADLNQLLNDLFAMVGEEMRAHTIEVDLELGTPPPRAWVDPGQLRQAMLNILRNSREAMPNGGHLRVRTASNGEQCTVVVEDDGEGISATVLARVFEPFYSTKPEGTGLGLSLTEQIVSDHQGQIEISAAEPRGTRVVITLPSHPPST